MGSNPTLSATKETKLLNIRAQPNLSAIDARVDTRTRSALYQRIDDDLKMDLDLYRQRRNLIAISSILLLFDFAHVTITKVGILGTDLVVGDARVLLVSAWVLWAYLFLRYYQYWRADETRYKVRNSYHTAVRGYFDDMLRKKNLSGPWSSLHRLGWLKYEYIVNEYDLQAKKQIEKARSPVPRLTMLFWRVSSVFHVALKTPHATDHLLPFFVAVAAPMVSLAKFALAYRASY